MNGLIKSDQDNDLKIEGINYLGINVTKFNPAENRI